MKKITLLIVLLISFCAGSLWAQDRVISGNVTTASDGVSLPGASVRIKGTTLGTISDLDGKFSLKISKDAQVLEISFVGMMKESIELTAESVYNVALKAETSNLEEVVVTAFGAKQAKRDIGYGVQEIKGEGIANAQRGNFVNSLQGRIAGATVTTTSGQPGSSSSIMLRGVSSIGRSNQPLFIVDGVPVDNTTFTTGNSVSSTVSGADYANRRFDFSNRAADLNPDDFESITVLKGAEAAALYGIDAASGAIVITTKKGKMGKGKLSYSNNFSLAKVYHLPEISNKYSRGYTGVSDTMTRSFYGAPYATGVNKYDNLKNFYRTGVSQSHNVSFEGGSDRVTYRLSTALLNEQGIEPGSDNKKVNVTLSGSAKLTDKLTSEGSLTYVSQDLNKVQKGDDGAYIGLLLWPSNDNAENYLTPAGNRRTIMSNILNADGSQNPYFNINKNRLNDKTDRVYGNVFLAYKPLSWLTFSGRTGWDFYSTEMHIKYHPESNLGFVEKGVLERNIFNVKSLNINYFVEVNKIFGDIKVNAKIGSDVLQKESMNNSLRGTTFYLADFDAINNVTSSTLKARTAYSMRRTVSMLGSLNLGYKDYLTLSLTHRNDWSSTLPKATRSFGYSSANASFVFTELMKNDILSFGKLRAAYGEAGKDPGAYQDQAALELKPTTGGGFGFGFTAPNSNLIAEYTKSWEVGTDLKFLNNRFGLEFSYWNKRVEDQLVPDLRMSYGTHFVLSTMNGGTFESHGWELTGTFMPLKSKEINWTLGMNLSKSGSKLVKLPAGLTTFYNSDTWAYANVVSGVLVNQPVTIMLGYDYYKNAKGDVLISPSTGLPLKNTGLWQPVGDRNPDFMLGITNDFSWKNITVSFLFDIRKGGDVYNGNELMFWNYGISKRQDIRNVSKIIPGVLKDGLEETANPTRNTIQVTPSMNTSYYTTYSEQDYIDKNVSWVKLSDITINVSAPKSLLNKMKVFSTASIFFTANDLFYITNYAGVDPNVNINTAATTGAGGAGFDYGSIPTPRAFKFGIKVSL